MIRNILLALIVAINLYFIIYFLRDLFKNKQNFKEEPGDMRLLPFTSFITFFLSTFGVSDFAIGTFLYPKLKWVSMKKLPGTLNTQCVVPVAVMALSYITAINVGIKTLAVCIICQIIGAYLGPRFVVKLPEKTIKLFVGIGLVIAAFLIFMGQMNCMAEN